MKKPAVILAVVIVLIVTAILVLSPDKSTTDLKDGSQEVPSKPVLDKDKEAVEKTDSSTTKQLPVSKIDEKSMKMFIALRIAVAEGDKKVLQDLIDQGADVNLIVGAKPSVLHFAAERGNKEIVELLISNGANINNKDQLLELTILHSAAKSNNTESMKYLLEQGLNINAQDKNGKTSLDHATTKQIKTLLLKHGGKHGEDIK